MNRLQIWTGQEFLRKSLDPPNVIQAHSPFEAIATVFVSTNEVSKYRVLQNVDPPPFLW